MGQIGCRRLGHRRPDRRRAGQRLANGVVAMSGQKQKQTGDEGANANVCGLPHGKD